jgi:thiol-disulfide isomerase/thioredoxin
MKALMALLVSAAVLLAGCVSEEVVEDSVDESEQLTTPTATAFPDWTGVAHNNTTVNASQFLNTTYMAYFSAPWCAHCESTIDAYDQVLPAGKIAVFSMESREEYGNMSEWHNRTEESLNRTIDRPFMLHPELAKAVDVKSIPHAVFVNAQGYVFHVEVGKETNQTYIRSLWDLTASAHFDEAEGWNHQVNFNED